MYRDKENKGTTLKKITERVTSFLSSTARSSILATLAASALLPASSGCQYMQIRYLENPEHASFITREIGRTQNELDAFLPTTYTESGERALESITNIPRDLVTNPLAVISDTYGCLAQIPNWALLLFTSNTARRAELLGQDSSAYNPGNDNVKLALDGLTDVLKFPLRLGLYVADPRDIVPDTFELGAYEALNSVGLPVNEERARKLSGKFLDENEEFRYGRVAINSLFGINNTLDYLLWGEQIIDGKKLPTTSDYSLETTLPESAWSGVNSRLSPGYIENGRFYPSNSLLSRLLIDARNAAAIALPLGLSNVEGGEQIAKPADGVKGGEVLGGEISGSGGN